MKWRATAAALVAAATVTAGPAYAAPIIIDIFDTNQLVSDPPFGAIQTSSEIAAPGVIGGYRDMAVQTNGNGTALQVVGGQLGFSNNFSTTGSGTITYDGMDGDPDNVDTSGLGGFNLVKGSNPFFFFDIAFADTDLTIGVQAWDILGNSAIYTETLTTIINPTLYFTDFVGTIDWSQVGALQFTVSGDLPNLDGALNGITVDATPIPLPASALLLLGGLGGLGVARLRKRKNF